MTRVPTTLAVVDAGGATTSVALLGQLGGRWHFLGGIAGSSDIPDAALLGIVATRLRAADPSLAADLGLDASSLADVPRLEARSRPPATLVVLGASRRSVGVLAAEARRTGWRVAAASTESHDPREMTELALGRDVGAVLIGAGDPPGPDERAALDDLAALGTALLVRRADLPIILCGGMRGRRTWSEAFDASDATRSQPRVIEVGAVAGRRAGDDGELRAALDGLRADSRDGRQALARSAASLADLLDLRVEVVDIGIDGGSRALADPGVGGDGPRVASVISAEGALVPLEPDDSTVDSVLAWTTGSLDRHRMSDRLRELRGHPWVDASGDGARLRLAAASAALARLAAVTGELGARPAPDVTIIGGGAFAMAPASAIALAVADTIRRTGATQLAWDHARLLGPIGTIDDDGERRTLLADLLADGLTPLGTVIVTGGLGARRRGPADRRSAGTVHLVGGGDGVRRDLVPGDVAFLDLPPGAHATARLEFNEPIRFGRRTRHVAVPVSGGLAGLLLDMREVPLRLPERRDRRRTMLADWAALVWPRDDR